MKEKILEIDFEKIARDNPLEIFTKKTDNFRLSGYLSVLESVVHCLILDDGYQVSERYLVGTNGESYGFLDSDEIKVKFYGRPKQVSEIKYLEKCEDLVDRIEDIYKMLEKLNSFTASRIENIPEDKNSQHFRGQFFDLTFFNSGEQIMIDDRIVNEKRIYQLEQF